MQDFQLSLFPDVSNKGHDNLGGAKQYFGLVENYPCLMPLLP